ncbi:hypothetical protein KM1_040000 [Entamoeba histolytica HM-3:IMSS]|uniref:Uncharacterized protein n=1 Tax=Entamoeba histolytica HM-3:IMSS TaxID=885315 RepID=M7W1L7_ENTHI|nr:hypothetical protein KM1_040000 [Entamoeba histolytica HM-3:IMSS]
MTETCLFNWLKEKYQIEIKKTSLSTNINYTDEKLIQSLPPQPKSIDDTIKKLFPNAQLFITNIHRFTKPIYCYSILEGSQFQLNSKFSSMVKFSSSNNNYQNLYLSYKKSTILKKLTQMANRLNQKAEITNTSIPGLVITYPEFYIQLSIDRYEGYYNYLLFESYKKLHPSISLLFECVDLIHQNLFPTNQHLSTLTRVMVVHFLHNIGIPSLQDITPCNSPNHIIHTYKPLCTLQKVEWSECPYCVNSHIPKDLSLGKLLNQYLIYYLNFDYSTQRIVTSPSFYADKPQISTNIVFSVLPPFVPWVLLSTATTTFELQDMLFMYKSVQRSLTTTDSQFSLSNIESDIIVSEVDVYDTVMIYSLSQYFQTKTLLSILNESDINAELLIFNPTYISSFCTESGVIFLHFSSIQEATYFHWILPFPFKRCYVSSSIFESRPNGSFYINTRDPLLF